MAASASTRRATARCRSSPMCRAGSVGRARNVRRGKILPRCGRLALLCSLATCCPLARRRPFRVRSSRRRSSRTSSRPAVPASFAGSPAAASQDRGWAFLQAGDLETAEREFEAALKTTPAFYPAETSLGYVELARKDAEGGAAAFRSRARARDGTISPRSSVAAQALLALNRETEALPRSRPRSPSTRRWPNSRAASRC